jgi:hypothetical protein
MTKQFVFGVLAYVLPTFPLGYFWHLTIFKSHYESLQIYRDDIIIPFGLASMVIQGAVWSYIYGRLFAGESVLRGALKFAALAAPLAWTFMVLVVGAKHHMTSVPHFVAIETAFTVVQYLVVSPLMALAYASRK